MQRKLDASKLQRSELRIKRRAQKQISVPALRDNAPLLDHNNAVRLLHRREPMRND